MSNECKNYTDLLSTLDYHDRKKETLLGVNLTKAGHSWMDRIAVRLSKIARGPEFILNEKHIRQAIKQEYGAIDERMELAVKLTALIEAHPGLENMIGTFMSKQITRMEKLGEVAWKEGKFGERAIDFNTLPKSVLKSTINEIQSIIRHGYGEKIGKGALGKLLLQFTTPKKMARKESTGAIFDMRKTVRDFPTNQFNRIARFMKKDPTKTDFVTLTDKRTGKKMNPKIRDYGMEDILQEIANLAYDESLSKLNISNAQAILNDLFTKYNLKDDLGNRWMKIDENGNITIATKYEKTDINYKETGDPIYSLQEYKSYEEVYGKRVIPFNDKMIKKFKEESERYVELHKNVYDYLLEESTIEREKLYSEIRSLFPKQGWTDKDITQLFFEEDPSDYRKWKTLDKKQQQLVSFIHENATRYNVLKPFVFNSRKPEDPDGKVDKGRESFPVTYDQMKFSLQWDEMIFKYEQLLERVELELSNPDIALEGEQSLLAKRKRYISILKRAYRIRDRKDDYPVDIHSGTYLALGADSKHIEHISNAFNILDGRTDAGAYNTYLTHNMSSIERMSLSVDLIRNLKKAKSEPVQDYLVNMYKVATYQPDAASGFLWLKYDSESVSKMFGKVGITISAAKIDRKMKQVLSFTSGNMLRGYPTAIQNYTAVIQKYIDVGIERVVEAYGVMRDGGKDLERIIALSGIVDFREFFSTKLTNEAVNLGAEQKNIMDMTGAMVQYWKDAGKIPENAPGRKKKLEILRKQLEQRFNRSIKSIPDPERLDKRIKVQRDIHRQNLLQKYVDYAINKEYEAAPYIKNAIFKKGASIAEMYASFAREHMPTMGKTETSLRTLSFIIGIRAAMRKGLIPEKKITDLEGDELRAAIAIGREYTEEMDFGLSRQDIGPIGQSDIGAFFTKFKVWPFQKFAKDLDTIRLAYFELKDVDNKYFDFKAGLKMLNALVPFAKNQKSLRTASPALAAFRTWIFTQGLWTAIWDFAIMGPFLLVPGVRKLTRHIPGMRTIGGASSDLISLMLLVPGLAVALASGEGEDDWEKVLDYYSRRTIFGFGARWSMDFFLTMLATIEEEDSHEYSKRVSRLLAPWSPPVVKEAITSQPAIKEVIKAVD